MPNPDLSGLLDCNYGTAAFQVEGYSYRQADEVRQGFGRTGIRCSVEVRGYLQADNQADLANKIAGFQTDSLIDGRDLFITGLGSAPEFSLLNAWCYDGGPHVACEITDHDVALCKKVRLTCVADIIPPEARGTQPVDNFRVSIATRPDMLRTITRTGELNGTGLADWFVGVLVPQVRAQYDRSMWVMDTRYETALDPVIPRNSKLTYTITVRENADAFPATPGETLIVDGTATKHVERDEHMRKTTVWEFDLLMDPASDAGSLLGNVRPQNVTILRENVQIDSIRENRLRASFTILESGSGTPAMNWTETLRVQPAEDFYEEMTFIGADPIYVKRPRQAARVTQSGSAAAVGVYRKAPNAIYPMLAAQKDVTLNEVNDVEKSTAWNYSMYLTDNRGVAVPIDQLRPSDLLPRDANAPQFYPAPANTGANLNQGISHEGIRRGPIHCRAFPLGFPGQVARQAIPGAPAPHGRRAGPGAAGGAGRSAQGPGESRRRVPRRGRGRHPGPRVGRRAR